MVAALYEYVCPRRDHAPDIKCCRIGLCRDLYRAIPGTEKLSDPVHPVRPLRQPGEYLVACGYGECRCIRCDIWRVWGDTWTGAYQCLPERIKEYITHYDRS